MNLLDVNSDLGASVSSKQKVSDGDSSEVNKSENCAGIQCLQLGAGVRKSRISCCCMLIFGCPGTMQVSVNSGVFVAGPPLDGRGPGFPGVRIPGLTVTDCHDFVAQQA